MPLGWQPGSLPDPITVGEPAMTALRATGVTVHGYVTSPGHPTRLAEWFSDHDVAAGIARLNRYATGRIGSMPSRIASVTFDCENALSLGEFWAQVVGPTVGLGPPEPSEFFASVTPGDDGSPMMMFPKIPEGKTAKNRAHLDLATGDRAAEVTRLVELGAIYLYDKDEWGISWATLTDPEGNEFCVSEHLT